MSDDGNLFLMLTYSDVSTMQSGQTKFVDQRQLLGRNFKAVNLSIHRDKPAIIEVLRKAGHNVTDDMLRYPEPLPNEDRCSDCDGLMPAYQINNGKCIVCWRKLAVKLMGESN